MHVLQLSPDIISVKENGTREHTLDESNTEIFAVVMNIIC